MKSKESVSLKKVISNVMGDLKSPKYLQGLDFAYIDSNDIYQGALSNLLNGNTEKTLKCLIFGIDLDKDNNSLIHLARTMLFSLSEDFHESGGDIYRQKYSDLGKAIKQLNQKLEKITDEYNTKIALMDEIKETIEKKKKSLLFFLQKSKLNKQFELNRIESNSMPGQIIKLEEEIEKVSFLEKIEEYTKVLGIVLEVCIFPARFSWTLTQE
ncbi:MAG: hypothetical protein H7263_00985 [Candidatus Sericytochromatia bacterium]|nr:hypothetical protein [Candidatus Sericytochromatia bacterium]